LGTPHSIAERMILLRHGQSEFNLHFTATRRDPGIEDPGLTPLGREQAEAAARDLRDVPLTRLIASPYTRALETAAPILAERALSLEVTDLVRERYAFSCDIGSAPVLLAERFPQHDFAHLPARWWPNRFEEEASVIGRAARFRARMAADPEHETTLLVSHWAFILALTGISVPNGGWLRYDPRTPAPESLIWHP
jgi:broad specificity phosphatase PhoE